MFRDVLLLYKIYNGPNCEFKMHANRWNTDH